MSDSKPPDQRIGFSTGALERGDFRAALTWMQHHQVLAAELSALRYEELEPLVNSIAGLPLSHFSYVSFHAPSSFPAELESRVVELLKPVHQRGWNIVVHPDVIYNPSNWTYFEDLLLIENMDRRKAVGRNETELDALFQKLPKARLCLDVAHARQMDTTLNLLWKIITRFKTRIAEIHISELDSRCQHQPMSRSSVMDYRKVAGELANTIPVIIESMMDNGRKALRLDEMRLAETALTPA